MNEVNRVVTNKSIRGIYLQETNGKSMNSIFITLIPKKIKSNNVSNFHPISLETSVYKIIIMLLSWRLSKAPDEERFIPNNRSMATPKLKNLALHSSHKTQHLEKRDLLQVLYATHNLINKTTTHKRTNNLFQSI